MKNLLLLLLLFSVVVLIPACENEKREGVDNDDMASDTVVVMTKADSIKRGDYLVQIGGCRDCHSPKVMTDHGPEPDRERHLSGHPATEVLPKITDKSMNAPGNWILINSGITAFSGPWGTSFAANLTPHETGIGNWSYDNFKRAMKEGKFKGLENGRMILPPMPWPNFANITDEDLHCIYLYFKSLPPVDNLVPTALPPG